MPWFISIILPFTALGFALGGTAWLLGRRFITEFTRPGVTVEYGTPEWGNWTFPDTAGEPARELQRAIIFQSADGVLLRGEFWAQTHSAPTIVLSHGFHFPSCYFRSVAALEYAHGANVLLFDYRGHGKSSQSSTTCGNAEVNDLTAAVDVAASQAETAEGRVYIHGFSMGAAVALLLPTHAAIAGIIADSSYARLDEMIHLLITQIFAQEIPKWHPLAKILHPLIPALAHLTLFGGRLLFQARYHHSLIARPEQTISSQATNATGNLLPPLLLIHAENDPLIALHHAHRLVTVARAAGRVVQVYYTPCAIHCGSYGYDPQQYMTLLLAFMAL